jgi:hypothetical protein
VEEFCQQGTVPHDPEVDRGVIDRYPTFLHEFFSLAITSKVRHVPTHAWAYIFFLTRLAHSDNAELFNDGELYASV